MEVQLLLLDISLMTLWSLSCSAILSVSSSPLLAKPNCQSHCGDVEIPYPFGIGPNCSHGPWFQILCDNSTNLPKPFLNLTDGRPEVLEISLAGTLKIKNPITFSDCPNKPNHRQTPNLFPTPFWFSDRNKFTSVSCGRLAWLVSQSTAGTMTSKSALGTEPAVCLSVCDYPSSILVNNSCGGIDCCQTSLRSSIGTTFSISFGPLILNDTSERTCKYAFLVDPEWFTSNSTNTSAIAEMDDVPMVLDWTTAGSIDNSTEENRNCTSSVGPCSCLEGYQGNPYLRGGCQVLCSVFGLLFHIIGAWWLHKVIKKRKNIKRKQKFFSLNGGLLLEQQLSSGEVNVEKIKLFNAKELEKATDRFNVNRVLGQGGQGTVYKGMLTDGKIVAVKKSKVVDGGEVNQFINEIVILSQINHRNVVKLLGCCLESEVPLLVYEFLPNGTLSQYIHSRDEDFPLTWEMRLRVGTEVAGALSYLHSSASMPIYHRDIKSSNILLDDKYRAKVADFGTSRTVSIDKTHLTMTHVNGTFGYLDPEYFQSSQFTDKSDVYSFGVVLAELLTGQKPVSVTRSQEGKQDGRSLATHFIVSMEESCLFDILDAEVMKGGKKEEIVAVANLAKRCLNMKGKKRPTMKEIAAELEGILMSSKSSDVEHIAEVERVQTEIAEVWDVSTSTGSHMDTGSSLYVQPLLSFRTR
ncbi:wall-associated receptor kinase-like 10 isoform X2 [Rosa chinensis]|uniref:wall-associated receptor kinase-like 10 isoform X2 n=1 Tax=Rosa chinensis TaxID=74649 RepID=UPI001AD8B22B|nr:wall-associated receptor kinase-like 10 isoform X2 [Rosa chinensis]